MRQTKKNNWLPDIRLYSVITGLVTFLVYIPAMENSFVTWDDNDYVYANDHIRNLDFEFFKWAFTEFHASNWHPLTWVSHAVDYAIWQLNPKGHHLSSIIIHSINTLLVTLLTHRVFRVLWPADQTSTSDRTTLAMTAVLTGLFFGLHPLHVESVAWISERKDLLCGFFYLTSLLFYLRSRGVTQHSLKTPAKVFDQDYMTCFALFALALMSKPMAISLPFALVLLDWLLGWNNDGPSWRRLLLAKLPFFIVALLSAVVTIAAQESGNSLTSLTTAPLMDRIWVGCQALVGYLQNILWPVDLLPYYRYPATVDWLAPVYLGSAFVVIATTSLAILAVFRHRALAVAWGIYVITLFPVLGIVKVGSQAMADRYMYLPSVAPFMALAAVLVLSTKHLSNRKATRTGLLLFMLVSAVGVLSPLTINQVRIWKDGETLWSYVLQHDDKIPLAYEQIGVSHFEKGQFHEAEEMFSKALMLNPLDAGLLSNLAICYLELDETDKAMSAVNNALKLDRFNLQALNTLGEVHMSKSEYPEANRAFFRAMQMEPSNPLRVFNLAVSFDKLNDTGQACNYWRRFMAIDVTQKHDAEITRHLADIGCPLTDHK